MVSIATQDIVLAASLRVLGYKVAKIERDGNKGVFHFDGVDEQHIKQYDLQQLLVEPVAFNSAIKSLTTATKRSL